MCLLNKILIGLILLLAPVFLFFSARVLKTHKVWHEESLQKFDKEIARVQGETKKTIEGDAQPDTAEPKPLSPLEIKLLAEWNLRVRAEGEADGNLTDIRNLSMFELEVLTDWYLKTCGRVWEDGKRGEEVRADGETTVLFAAAPPEYRRALAPPKAAARPGAKDAGAEAKPDAKDAGADAVAGQPKRAEAEAAKPDAAADPEKAKPGPAKPADAQPDAAGERSLFYAFDKAKDNKYTYLGQFVLRSYEQAKEPRKGYVWTLTPAKPLSDEEGRLVKGSGRTWVVYAALPQDDLRLCELKEPGALDAWLKPEWTEAAVTAVLEGAAKDLARKFPDVNLKSPGMTKAIKDTVDALNKRIDYTVVLEHSAKDRDELEHLIAQNKQRSKALSGEGGAEQYAKATVAGATELRAARTSAKQGLDADLAKVQKVVAEMVAGEDKLKNECNAIFRENLQLLKEIQSIQFRARRQIDERSKRVAER